MSFMKKIKDFFYDEEYEEEVPQVRKQKKEEKVEKRYNIYDIEKEKNKFENNIVKSEKLKKEKREDVPEKELFRSERTFNFPVDIETDTIFQPVHEEHIKKTEQKKEIKPKTRRTIHSQNNSSLYIGKKQEEKKFVPTPVISPIYGVLNQNYTKEDINDKSETKEFSFDKKIDFDSIRKKAYSTLDDEIEKTLTEKKEKFYEKVEIEEKKKIEDEYKEEPYKKDEVIITYGEDDPDSFEEEEIQVPTLTKNKNKKKEAVDVKQEEKEDLFQIIDNMYKNSEEEDEE